MERKDRYLVRSSRLERLVVPSVLTNSPLAAASHKKVSSMKKNKICILKIVFELFVIPSLKTDVAATNGKTQSLQNGR